VYKRKVNILDELLAYIMGCYCLHKEILHIQISNTVCFHKSLKKCILTVKFLKIHYTLKKRAINNELLEKVHNISFFLTIIWQLHIQS